MRLFVCKNKQKKNKSINNFIKVLFIQTSKQVSPLIIQFFAIDDLLNARSEHCTRKYIRLSDDVAQSVYNFRFNYLWEKLISVRLNHNFQN